MTAPAPPHPPQRLGLASRLHRIALVAYPAAFRARFGAEMQRTFEARVAAQGRGAFASSALAAFLLADACVSGVLERWRPFTRRGDVNRPTLESLLADLRLTWRRARREPLYPLMIVFTLALGLGANTAIFSVLHAVLLRPLPYADTNRLVMVWSDNTRLHDPANPVSPADFVAIKEGTHSFSAMEAMYSFLTGLQVRPGADVETVQAATVTPGMFGLLGRDALLGRPLRADDPPNVIVLSADYWRRRFGGDPKVVGSTLHAQGVPAVVVRAGADQLLTIVGVMPADFVFPYRSMLGPAGFSRAMQPDVWVPLSPRDGRWLDASGQPNTAVHYLAVVGRLRPDATVDAARQDVQAVAAARALQSPTTNAGWGATLRSLHDQTVGGVRPALAWLAVGVGLVLLIACVNVVNLLLSRVTGETRSLAIRSALGASAGRLVQQTLVESVTFATVGGLAGVGVLFAGIRGLVAMAPREMPRIAEVSVTSTVVLFALGLSALVGLLVGVLPAAAVLRSRAADGMAGGHRLTASPRRRRLRRALIVTEVTMAMALALVTGLLLRSFAAVLHVDPGFDASHLLTFQLNAPTRLPDAASRLAFYDDLEARLRAMPGVVNVGATTRIPLGSTNVSTVITVEGRDVPAADRPEVEFRRAGFDYFGAMRMPILRGRSFDANDGPRSAPVVLINDAMARRVFPNEDPIGRRVSAGPGNTPAWMTVVGVVGSIHHGSLEEAPRPELYLSFRQATPSSPFVVVRTTGDPAATSEVARAVIRSVGADAPARFQTMDEIRQESVSERRFAVRLLAGLGVLALGLAGIGVYGVIALAVAERRTEMGVRLALGARPSDVAAIVLRDAIALAVSGVAIGIAACVVAGPWLRSSLFGVSPLDPATYLVSAVVLIVIAAGAALIPARRAMSVDPAWAVRRT